MLIRIFSAETQSCYGPKARLTSSTLLILLSKINYTSHPMFMLCQFFILH